MRLLDSWNQGWFDPILELLSLFGRVEIGEFGKHALHYPTLHNHRILYIYINSSDTVGAGVISRELLRYPSILVGSNLGFGGLYWTKSDKNTKDAMVYHGLSGGVLLYLSRLVWRVSFISIYQVWRSFESNFSPRHWRWPRLLLLEGACVFGWWLNGCWTVRWK